MDVCVARPQIKMDIRKHPTGAAEFHVDISPFAFFFLRVAAAARYVIDDYRRVFSISLKHGATLLSPVVLFYPPPGCTLWMRVGQFSSANVKCAIL